MSKYTFIFSSLAFICCSQSVKAITIPPNLGLLNSTFTIPRLSPTVSTIPATISAVNFWPAPNADYEISRNLYINIKTYADPSPSITSKLRIIDALLDIFRKLQLRPSGSLPSSATAFYSSFVLVTFEAVIATEEMPMLNRAQALAVVEALEEMTGADGPRAVEVGYVKDGEGRWIGQFSLKVRGRK